MRQTYLPSIQALRGIAALLVVSFHAALLVENYGWTPHAATLFDYWGRIGVDIFFVISGFVMVITTYNRQQGSETALRFIKSRLIRIAPIYWLLTLLMTGALVVAPSAFNGAKLDWSLTLASALFLPSPERAAGNTYPVLYVGWTLTYEMFFYVVFAGLLLARRSIMPPGLLAIFGGLAMVGWLMRLDGAMAFLTNSIILEFVFGCIVGILWVRKARVSRPAAILMLCGGAALAAASIPADIPMSWRVLAWGGPAALVVAGAAFLDGHGGRGWARSLMAIGDSSYSLYLTHIFVQPVTGRLISKLDPSHALPGDLVWLTAILGAVVAGHCFFLVVERPMNDRLTAWLIPPRPQRHHPVSQPL